MQSLERLLRDDLAIGCERERGNIDVAHTIPLPYLLLLAWGPVSRGAVARGYNRVRWRANPIDILFACTRANLVPRGGLPAAQVATSALHRLAWRKHSSCSR